MNLSLGRRPSPRPFVAVAGAVLLSAACGVVQEPPGPALAGTPTTLAVPPASPGASPEPAVRYHPAPSDARSWPDACQMLSEQQLATVLSGAVTQTGYYGELGPQTATPRYVRCVYLGRDSDGNLLSVMVRVDLVAPLDSAQRRFATDRGNELSPTTEPIGDQAFSGPYGIEVRQGMTVWTVAVDGGNEDQATRQSQTEQLARSIAPELS